MRKPIKLNKEQNIYFVSDLHLGHNKPFVVQARGFTNVIEHNKFIIDNINQHVGENDILFNLGDFALYSDTVQVTDYFNRINCKNIYYVWGNHEGSTTQIYHEAVKEQYGKYDIEVYPLTWNNVTFIGNYSKIRVGKKETTLSHFAPRLWDKSHHGTFAICGHSHGSFPEILPSHSINKVVDVGVDVALTYFDRQKVVFSWEDILEIMETKMVVSVDHHDESTT